MLDIRPVASCFGGIFKGMQDVLSLNQEKKDMQDPVDPYILSFLVQNKISLNPFIRRKTRSCRSLHPFFPGSKQNFLPFLVQDKFPFISWFRQKYSCNESIPIQNPFRTLSNPNQTPSERALIWV